MTTVDQELVDIALEALSKQNVRVKDLERLTKLLDGRDKYDSAKYAKDLKSIGVQLDSIGKDVEDRIESTIKAIPVPSDGVDGKDGKNGVNGKDGVNGSDGKDGINGLPGKDGSNGIDGKQGARGKKGDKGDDGVGISKVSSKGNKITISLTDGTSKTITIPEGAGGHSVGGYTATFLSKLRDLRIDGATEGQVLTKEGQYWVPKTPIIGGGSVDTARIELEAMFKVAETTAYKELTYTDGNITDVSIYTNSGKLTKLFTKIIGYNVDNNIDTISITDEVNSGTLNKTIVYSDGNISSISSIYTA